LLPDTQDTDSLNEVGLLLSEVFLVLKAFDINWFMQINHNLQNPFFDWIMPAISKAGQGGLLWIILGLVLIIFGRPDIKKAAFLMLTALFAGYVAGDEVLKQIFQRPRPFEAIAGVNLLVAPPGSFSFPSGHATAAFACGLVLTRKTPILSWPVLILAGAMAFSRVYVGVHYPLDVLAGSILGVACAILVLKLEPVIFQAVKKIATFY